MFSLELALSFCVTFYMCQSSILEKKCDTVDMKHKDKTHSCILKFVSVGHQSPFRQVLLYFK